ncbi:DNA cytosine methyltransferase [Nocardia sp. NPDC005978]|uniref:DNA cytosine methyltransferase n=1 Tax=Nocardia sp. NPDC005978 TaxID=3156725 RepID=UPI0033BF5F29
MSQLSLIDSHGAVRPTHRSQQNPQDRTAQPEFTSIEICAGAGGQAIGLRQAGFGHLALVELDQHAVQTLEHNIHTWQWEGEHCEVFEMDVKEFDPFRDMARTSEALRRGELDLLAGGVPCPPFSHAGKQLGRHDDRDLFPRMIELVETLLPRAVLIENVRGVMDPKFKKYRDWIIARLEGGVYFDDTEGQFAEDDGLGYTVCRWDVLEASDFGVPQLRPRAILVALRNDVLADSKYEWPTATTEERCTVARALEPSMRERFESSVPASVRRPAFDRWLARAAIGGVAPTLVGGSKKHGGGDLGPSRAKAAWRKLGIDPMGIANDIATSVANKTQERDLLRPDGPMLTVAQASIIQGFPPEWSFSGGKTAQYRQVGNAFPPPVAKAVGRSIIDVLAADRERGRSISA